MLRARWHFERADWEQGLDDVIATMMLARHIGRDRVWSNFHFGVMIESICIETAGKYLPSMPADILERFETRLDGLPEFTSYQDVYLAHHQILDWAADNISQAQTPGELRGWLESAIGKDEAAGILGNEQSASKIRDLVDEAYTIITRSADLLALPPDEYLAALESQIEPLLKENPIAVYFGPPYDLARQEAAVGQLRRMYLKAAIDVLRHGRDALDDHPDPYGKGSFTYRPFEGGFELSSGLLNPHAGLPLPMDFGIR
jgi:hypothetical protein